MAIERPKLRNDIVFHPDPEDPARIIVKDPIRHEFVRMNELQVAMMRALDGNTSIEEIQELIGEELEVDLDQQQIARFINRLESLLLLDVSSYRIDDGRTRKKVLQYLKKRNLALRAKARNDSEEGTLFEKATRELHEGDPCVAAACLERVLVLNPANERARQVLACIHEAFFKTKIEAPSHAKMMHLFDPDALLGRMDRTMGWFWFSGLGVIALILLTLSAIPSVITVLSVPNAGSDLTLFDGVVAAVVFTAAAFAHEMAHGLACKHYGGKVTDVGVFLYYGVIPAAYCDVSDSYLFPHRRQKIIVMLAGTLGHVAVQAVMWHMVALTDPSFPLWQGIVLSLVLSVIPTIENFMPLVKFDGYYALADYLGIPNLRERSIAYVKARLQQSLLGVPTQEAEVGGREARVLGIFGAAACVYTVIFIYGIWISFLLPLAVRHFGNFGLVLATFYFVRLFGFVVVRYMVRFGRFVARERRQIFTPVRSLAFATVTIGLGLLLAAPWPLRVDATMAIEPRERAMIRAAEPGFLRDVLVRAGDKVEAGQILAVLDAPTLRREETLAAQDVEIARSRLALLEAGARTEEVAIASAHASTERARQSAANAKLRDASRRSGLDVGSTAEVLQARAAASHAAGDVRISNATRELVGAGAREEEVAEAAAVLRLRVATHEALVERVERLTIRSPIAGVVVGDLLRERIGERIETGRELLEVHDTTRWRAKIIPNPGEPLGAVATGQEVMLRPLGAPGEVAVTTLGAIRPPEEGDPSTVVFYTAEFDHASWRSGMTGRARIHAPGHSVAYRLVAVPIIQIVEYDLWRRL